MGLHSFFYKKVEIWYCVIIEIWRVNSWFQSYEQFHLKLFVLHMTLSYFLSNFISCYIHHHSPRLWQQPLHWLPMLKLAISFLFFFPLFSTQPLECSFKNVASCSKSLCVWLISEQRSYLIPQALFLLSSDPFQVPSQQHNFLHSSLYLSAFRKR